MPKFLTYVTQPSQHTVHSKVGRQVAVNIGPFHTIRKLHHILLYKITDCGLSVTNAHLHTIDKHSSARWWSWHIISMQEFYKFVNNILRYNLSFESQSFRWWSTFSKQDCMHSRCCSCAFGGPKMLFHFLICEVHFHNWQYTSPLIPTNIYLTSISCCLCPGSGWRWAIKGNSAGVVGGTQYRFFFSACQTFSFSLTYFLYFFAAA